MKVEFTAAALRQLDEILTYIRERSPQGAASVKAKLQSNFDMLADHPLIGSTTNRPGVRRMVVAPYPYAVFYRVTGKRVIVQRIRHTARRPI